MKKIIIIITLSILAGCSSQPANTGISLESQMSKSSSGILETVVTMAKGIDETTDIAVSPIKTGSSGAETIAENIADETITNPVCEESLDSAKALINMTDDEIYALGMKRANELSGLFIDFLQFDVSRLVFPFDYDNRASGWVYITKDGQEYHDGEVDLIFFVAHHDTLNTYADIHSLFSQTCTPEYSTELLKFNSVQYTDDCDGQLCYSYTELGTIWLSFIERLEYVSYDIVDDKLVFNFEEIYYDVNYAPKPYTITLEKIDDEWLVSDCAKIDTHGYLWNMEQSR